MKIGLVSSAVPLISGGARNIVNWLRPQLEAAGHQVETIWLPQVDDPALIYQQMMAFGLLNLNDSFDRVVTFRPCAHLVQHRAKVVWFIHHLRIFYDLWESEYNTLPKGSYWLGHRDQIHRADTKALNAAHKVFSNSVAVQRRLKDYNGINAEVLYPPIEAPERFFSEAYGGEIVCICRMEHHKRQDLAIEAMRHVKTPVRLRLSGRGSNPAHEEALRALVRRYGLEDRVTIDLRWISEGEKVSLLSTALASLYIPSDEDSYGYSTLEAAHASKATVTTSDSGGVSEFVCNGDTGMVAEPEAEALAAAFDTLWSNRDFARKLGARARDYIGELRIDWQHVVSRVTS